MGFVFSGNEILIVASSVITVAAVLLAIVYTVRKQRSLAVQHEKPSKSVKVDDSHTDTLTAENAADEDEEDDDDETEEPNWNTKDPKEMTKILKGMNKCPMLHGLPHFSKIGGSWPPDKEDFVDMASQMSGNCPHGDNESGPHRDNESKVEDPKEYCDHIPSQVKRTQQRVAVQKIEESMDETDKEHEREVQRQQLEAIFNLMAEEKDKFGLDSMDDVQNQMQMYVQ